MYQDFILWQLGAKVDIFFGICCFLHVKNGGVLTNSRFWIPIGLTWVGDRGTENKKRVCQNVC